MGLDAGRSTETTPRRITDVTGALSCMWWWQPCSVPRRGNPQSLGDARRQREIRVLGGRSTELRTAAPQLADADGDHPGDDADAAGVVAVRLGELRRARVEQGQAVAEDADFPLPAGVA